MTEGRRTFLQGVAFFLAMAAFGALVLWVTRVKWQTELKREEARHRTYQANERARAGLDQLVAARAAQGEMRIRHARDAIALLSYAIDANATRELLAARAEAYEMVGDLKAAERDRERMRQ